MSGRRVALVTNVLAHYRVPCFQHLARALPGQIDYFVLSGEMPGREYVLASRAGNLPLRALPGVRRPRPPDDDLHLNDPFPALRGHAVIILGGWAEPSYLVLWALAVLLRKKVLFWIESTLNDSTRGGWKERLKRLMLQTAVGAVVPGERAAEYCRWLGLPAERIFTAPNAVDTDYFRNQAARLGPERDRLRAELGLEGVVVLFVGRMTERFKAVSTLIDAFVRMESENREGPSAELVLVGEGVDRAAYERQAAGSDAIRFVDFQEHDALCRYYAAADVLVLPSRSETWGLVLNEGMEFGLPLVVAETVGAAPDLATDGENGFVVPAGDATALAGALGRLVADEELRRRMGAASIRRIARYTPDCWAQGMLQAIRAAGGDG